MGNTKADGALKSQQTLRFSEGLASYEIGNGIVFVYDPKKITLTRKLKSRMLNVAAAKGGWGNDHEIIFMSKDNDGRIVFY